jgi:hypothetical protein
MPIAISITTPLLIGILHVQGVGQQHGLGGGGGGGG